MPVLTTALLLTALSTASALRDPIECGSCASWNQPQAPFKLHGDSYYVGPKGLAVVMIETPQGLALFDGALPQSAALVEANLQALGHDISEVRWIFVSHAHFDHVGGVAALQQASGAQVFAATGAAAALRLGDVPADDPQVASTAPMQFPAVTQVTEVADGETVHLGELAVTAHYTPGHTPGGSSWSWASCENEHCITAVYADSLNAVSAKGFRFSDDANAVAAFRQGIADLGALDCALLIAVHPSFTDLFERLEQRSQGGGNLLDPQACRTYADASMQRLEQRLAEEQQ